MYYYQLEVFTNLNLLCGDMNANCEVETSRKYMYIGTALQAGIKHAYQLRRDKYGKCYGIVLRVINVENDSRSLCYCDIKFHNRGAELDFHSFLFDADVSEEIKKAEKSFILNWRSYCYSMQNQIKALKDYAETLTKLEKESAKHENSCNCI